MTRSLIVSIALAAGFACKAGAQTPVALGDGLAFSLPSGWKATTLNNAERPPKQPGEFNDPGVLTMLMRAQPEDGQRTASLTVVRDTGFFKAGGGPFQTQDSTIRLKEAAAAQGFGGDVVTFSSRDTGPNSSYRGDFVGTNAAGQRRIFTLVSLGRQGGLALRCYWQADESDAASRNDFDTWMASLTFEGKPVGGAVNGVNAAVAGAMTGGTALPSTNSVSPVTPMNFVMPTSAETVELVNKNRDSLVVIQGQNGVGSGFICKWQDQPVLFTNTHVMSNNPQPRFSSLNGSSLTPGAAFLGVDVDVCRMSMPKMEGTLEVLPDMHSVVRIGDKVAVLGNSEGAGVVKALEGKVVGIGPNLVEVDAPFVPGNSGSPIIHLPTGKVIGIATYLLIRKVNSVGNVETAVRRFGFRLDNVKGWEPVNWQSFAAQSAQFSKIDSNTEEFGKLFTDARIGRLSSSKYTNPGIRRALETFERVAKGGSRMSEADQVGARRQLLSDLRSASMSDINSFDNRTAYDYFRRKVAEEKKFREEIYGGFSRAMDSVSR